MQFTETVKLIQMKVTIVSDNRVFELSHGQNNFI